jgi:hypothetical protein
MFYMGHVVQLQLYISIVDRFTSYQFVEFWVQVTETYSYELPCAYRTEFMYGVNS